MSELEALRDAVARVRAIHAPEVVGVHEGYGEEVWCPTCKHNYPCPTVAALDGAPEPEWEYGTVGAGDRIFVEPLEYIEKQQTLAKAEPGWTMPKVVRRRPAGPWLPVPGWEGDEE